VVLTATSVSITVETLKELGHLNSKSGTIILSAALIDDVLGIVLLTIVTGMSDTSVSLWPVLLKIVLFFLFAGVVGFIFYKVFERLTGEQRERRRYVLVAFSFCLILAWIAEAWFGVADITGAFIAGLVLSNTRQVHFINRRFDILSYILIAPMFFASVGLSIEKVDLSWSLLLLTVVLLVVAILSKILGCGLGARLSAATPRNPSRSHRHGLPRRGGADCRQQGIGPRADAGAVHRAADPGGCGHHHRHTHHAQNGLSGETKPLRLMSPVPAKETGEDSRVPGKSP
jgi:Kef-type K+ transport system membrane component KefB